MHGDPSQRFVGPVKTAIKTVVLGALPGATFDNVCFNSIERDRSVGASIVVARDIAPSVKRDQEGTVGGRSSTTWRDADQKLWARHRRSSLVVYFNVKVWTPSLADVTEALFNIVADMPRHCYDGHLLPASAPANPAFLGNIVELTPMLPELPDDTVNTSKTYYALLKVKAEGAIYRDALVSVPVSTVVRPAEPFFAQP